MGRFSAPGALVYFPGAAFLLATFLAGLSLLVVLRAGKAPAPGSAALPDEGRTG